MAGQFENQIRAYSVAVTHSRIVVIPAKAGIHSTPANAEAKWIPAFAGMTVSDVVGN